MGYRIVDTTADIGIEAWGSTKKELFEECARGLFDIMANRNTVESMIQIEWESEGYDLEDTLISMLNDIIFLADSKRMVFSDIKITKLKENRVKFQLYGEKIDPQKHEIGTEVKAATYHNIRIEKNGMYRTKVILDV